MSIENEVYVPMKGWVKPSCENCVADHIECPIKAILRDHLVEYYKVNREGPVENPENWEREKIDFAQWHCSRWQLDTEGSRKEMLQYAYTSTGMTPPEKITPEEQAKDLPLSLLSAAELNDLQKAQGPWTSEAQDTLKCPSCGNDYWQHGPRGGLAENIRCTKCGRIYNTELTGLVLVGRDMTNLPDASKEE